MVDALQFVVNGLFTGAVYGLIALGLTLIFGVLRVGDLAQGALFAVGAYVVFALSQTSDAPYALSVLAAAGCGALLSVFNGHVIYRRLRVFGIGATFIGAVALLLIYRNLLVIIFSWDPVEVTAPLSQQVAGIGGVFLEAHKLVVLVIAVIFMTALWFFLHRTRWGKGLRAVSQNESAALCLGINATAVSALAFALAGAFASGAGALLAPLWPFDPGSGTLFVLKAFAIAVIGQTRLRYVVLVAAAVGLSEVMMQAYGRAEFSDLVPFALLALLLVFKPQLLSPENETLPIARKQRRAAAPVPRRYLTGLVVFFLLVAFSLPFWLGNAFWLHLLILAGIFIVLVCGLDLLTGYTGIPSLTQAGLWGIGAYASALLAMRFEWVFPATLIGAVAIALLAAWGIGSLGLRLRQRWTSFTFIVGVVLTLLFESLASLTGGTHGLAGVPALEIWVPGWEPIKLNPFRNKTEYFYLVLVFVILSLWIKQRVVGSRMGLALVAIREDEGLARAVGIMADRYKLGVFLISAMFAALAGSLYAHYVAYLHPQQFTFVQSFNLLVMNMVGGAATLLGSVAGPLGLVVFDELTHPLYDTLAEIVFSMFLLFVLLYFPNGVAGIVYGLKGLPMAAKRYLGFGKEAG